MNPDQVRALWETFTIATGIMTGIALGLIILILFDIREGGCPMWTVEVRRSNGRLVKIIDAQSKYHAKTIKKTMEDKYDETYFALVVKR